MHRRSAALAACCLIALGGLAACGSDDEDTGSAPTTPASTSAAAPTTAAPTAAAGLTKAEFVTKANAICTAGNAEIEAASASLGATPTTAQIAAFATATLIPSVSKQLDDIRALGIPEADKATVEPILAESDAVLTSLKADPSQLEEDPFAAVNTKLTSYGLTACGES